MLLLWNVMQNKKFQYDVKVWNVFGLCPLVIWTRPIGVNYWLSMENFICLAIQSRVNGATYNSRPFKVEEIGLPVTLIWTRPSPQCVRMEGRNKILMGCATRPPKRTISYTWGHPNVMRSSLYRLIRYGLTNMLWTVILRYGSGENDFV